MATHSSILAWRIPWTEEPGRLQSMGSQESDTTSRQRERVLVLLTLTGTSCRVCINTPIERIRRLLAHREMELPGSPSLSVGIRPSNQVCPTALPATSTGEGRSESCSVVPDSLRRMDCPVHGILQARILQWVAVPFPRGSSQLRDQTQVSRIAGGFFTS